jgi:tRNA (cytidine/uridine-2'-O-)-methyltransferase
VTSFHGPLHGAQRLDIVLVEPEIPGNTGNAGRSCLALGGKLHLVEPLGFSLDDRAVRRAGLDYWAKVDPIVWQDWQTFEQQNLKGESRGRGGTEARSGVWFLSTEGQTDLWQVDLTGPTTLVFGCEARGLSSEIRDNYRDRLVRIPMTGAAVRSLNLSSCVATCLYEVHRQREAARARPGSRSPSETE